MLITCPKCHSIYEIDDNLIGRTGKNFRCVKCTNVWHALRSDALGYESEETDPYIEAIDISETALRNFPANKKSFAVPADSKSGRKTLSSDEVIKTEGNTDLIADKKPEITLTSDSGASFTISLTGDKKTNDKTPYLFEEETTTGLSAHASDHISKVKLFKGYKKTCFLLFLVLSATLAFILRREVVYFYPPAEVIYNKIGLTGYNNAKYLVFEQITADEREENGKSVLRVNAVIYNNSRYATNVPEIAVSSVPEIALSAANRTFKTDDARIKGHERTTASFALPIKGKKIPRDLTLGFVIP